MFCKTQKPALYIKEKPRKSELSCSNSRDLVREMRLELTRHTTHAPQTCLSTYSSTLANAIAIIAIMFPFVNTFLQLCRRKQTAAENKIKDEKQSFRRNIY